jgi:1-acyl-sn-glycerol-3-phosphate acyltransferase
MRAACILLCFACLTIPLMPLQQLFVWFWPRMAGNFPMHYHRVVLRILGVRVTIKGKPLSRGPAILAANHVSWLDIVILSSITPVSFIAKRDVNGWPFFGQLARLQRTVFVDRDRRHSTAASRNEMQERLAAGDILVLFAEGTSGDGANVKPFKTAFFAAAEHAHVKVQPVSIAYTGHRNLPMTRRQRPLYAWYGDMDLPPHLWEALGNGPVEIEVICHPPLEMAEAGNRKSLAKAAEITVRQGLVHALHGRP